MSKKWILVVLFASVATLFIAAGLQAGLEGCPEVITMENNEAFESHRMGIVEFTHTKHVEDYGYSCGECHHDDTGTPTDDIACGDEVASCLECHSEPGQPERGASKEEELEYYYGAVHQNCIDCHKAYNEETGEKTAPFACTQCHPRK
ncbi:MAG: cytochrome c3 family protein [Desulfosalsimonadaceae bacterium]